MTIQNNATFKAPLEQVERKDCLITLPIELTQLLYDSEIDLSSLIVVRLEQGPNEFFLGWCSEFVQSNKVQIDKRFASVLRMSLEKEVLISFVDDYKHNFAKSVSIEPTTVGDWEILETNASLIEENLLHQIRILCIDQNFIIKTGQLSILARVSSFELNDAETKEPKFCVINNKTEIYVKPRPRKTNTLKIKPMTLRVIKNNNAADKMLYINPASLNSYSALIEFYESKIEWFYGEVNKLEPKRTLLELKSNSNEYKHNNKLILKVKFDERVPLHQVAMSTNMMELLNYKQYSLVEIKHAQASPNVSKINIQQILPKMTGQIGATPKNKTNSKGSHISMLFEKWLNQEKNTQLILTHNMHLFLEGDLNTKTTLKIVFESEKNSKDTYWTEIDKISLNNTAINELGPEYAENSIITPRKKIEEKLSPTDGSTAEIIEKCQSALMPCLNFNVMPKVYSSILLSGNMGSGKSFVISNLFKRLQDDTSVPTYCYNIDCTEMSNKKITDVEESFHSIRLKALYHRPTLICFDKIDQLVRSDNENGEGNFRLAQIAYVFHNQVVEFAKKHGNIGIIATCIDPSFVHKVLFKLHAFNEKICIKAPNVKTREQIIKNMLSQNNRLNQNIDITAIAKSTEGHMPIDIKIICEKALNNCIVDSISSNTNLSLNTHNFLQAIKEHTPLSLKNVKLYKSTLRWDQIGGLKETRRVLKETLQWPIKYDKIFAKCPLRLRSGLLLYGYPGCGKTILASAIANECGVKFISVKGPEVLNKYIGESEKSVRDIFQRAQAAKPSILFFDEFESIAPKRGQDNNGVTDRVVNQLLTQMDGAEGLEGVYILAATSRPDLIDSALLRPGRLDKSLLCDLPTQEDRVEILKVVAKEFNIENVDFAEIAQRCQGFNGADLQAVIYNAYIEAIHNYKSSTKIAPEMSVKKEQVIHTTPQVKTNKQLNKTVERLADNIFKIDTNSQRNGAKTKNTKLQIKITRKEIENSLKTTKKSLDDKEIERFRKIYNEFENKSTSPSKNIGMKSTLR